MEVTKSTREFKYSGVTLKDPGAQFTLEQVREFYATLYPEIINAVIEGPTVSGPKTVYEFRRAVGTKGGADVVARVDAFLDRRKARMQTTGMKRHDARMHVAIANATGLLGRFGFDGGEVPSAAFPDARGLPLVP